MARDGTKSVYLTADEARLALVILRGGGEDVNAIAGGAALNSLAECLDGLLSGFDAIVIGDPYADVPKES